MSFKVTNSEKRSKELMYYIHTYVWGLAQQGPKFEIFNKFKEWKAEVENQIGREEPGVNIETRSSYSFAKKKASQETL